eukprot:Pgem_evm2s18182
MPYCTKVNTKVKRIPKKEEERKLFFKIADINFNDNDFSKEYRICVDHFYSLEQLKEINISPSQHQKDWFQIQSTQSQVKQVGVPLSPFQYKLFTTKQNDINALKNKVPSSLKRKYNHDDKDTVLTNCCLEIMKLDKEVEMLKRLKATNKNENEVLKEKLAEVKQENDELKEKVKEMEERVKQAQEERDTILRDTLQKLTFDKKSVLI